MAHTLCIRVHNDTYLAFLCNEREFIHMTFAHTHLYTSECLILFSLFIVHKAVFCYHRLFLPLFQIILSLLSIQTCSWCHVFFLLTFGKNIYQINRYRRYFNAVISKSTVFYQLFCQC